MNLETSIRELKGIGPKKEKLLSNLGITIVQNILENMPRDFEDMANFKALRGATQDEKATFAVRVIGIEDDRYLKARIHLLSFLVEDGTAQAKVLFFNSPFLKNSIKIGEEYFIYGKVNYYRNSIQINSPKMELKRNAKLIGSLVPIYNLTKGISNNDIVKLTKPLLNLNLFKEIIPSKYIDKYKLMDKNEAIRQIHEPQTPTKFVSARQRLAYEELLTFQLKMLSDKNNQDEVKVKPYLIGDEMTNFVNALPFQLTDGQKNALEDIFRDLKSGKKMNRLLQGDVGSGKTIIAIITMYAAFLNGYQSTIMAPTEILAKQHLESFRQLFFPLGVKVELLVGSTTAKNKKRILDGVSNGEIDILIGTHALIEENVNFYNLGLNITDEQHRFGVRQRERLNTKSEHTHILVMSATPIPRTLSLVLYSDLDISIINSLPPNRKKIETSAIGSNMLNTAIDFMVREVQNGRQAYIVCPLIEEGSISLNSASAVYEDLSERYKDIKFGLLHGRMNAEEKNRIMDEFKDNKINVLVSTTVIEVGVNVPNATVMIVYNAERFGLAQLHQLRGRVGRGEYKSYCILYNASNTDVSWERMKVMTDSTDGFYIANEDLRLRGGGDIFGTRQSGIMSFKFADVITDYKILKAATDDAKQILEADPQLQNKENALLNKAVNKYDEGFKILN